MDRSPWGAWPGGTRRHLRVKTRASPMSMPWRAKCLRLALIAHQQIRLASIIRNRHGRGDGGRVSLVRAENPMDPTFRPSAARHSFGCCIDCAQAHTMECLSRMGYAPRRKAACAGRLISVFRSDVQARAGQQAIVRRPVAEPCRRETAPPRFTHSARKRIADVREHTPAPQPRVDVAG